MKNRKSKTYNRRLSVEKKLSCGRTSMGNTDDRKIGLLKDTPRLKKKTNNGDEAQ